MPPSFSSTEQQRSVEIDDSQTLIPGLPNDIASLVLSFVPYSHQSRLKPTCKSWFLFFSSETLILDRQRLSILSDLLCIFPQDPSTSSALLFDAANLAWRSLPPLPCNPSTYSLCNFTSISLGPYLYLLGGSHFDARSYPLDRPLPSDSAFRFNFITWSWERISPMITPRGSFACAAVRHMNQIIVAGGGSRHNLFAAGGSRIRSVERYDVASDKWIPMDGLPSFRAGCEGFVVNETNEFWVMGGYGESRTISGVLPVDEYYRDALVMELKSDGGNNFDGKWRRVGDMWGEGQRARFGKIVVLEDENGRTDVFMLVMVDILRYDMAANRWKKETTIPRKAHYKQPFGFVVLDGELHVLTLSKGPLSYAFRPLGKFTKSIILFTQIYNPWKKTWRSFFTRPRFQESVDFNNAVACTIRL